MKENDLDESKIIIETHNELMNKKSKVDSKEKNKIKLWNSSDRSSSSMSRKENKRYHEDRLSCDYYEI